MKLLKKPLMFNLNDALRTPLHDDIQQSHLSSLIDYIKSKAVDIVTIQEGLEIIGNRIDVKDGKTEFFLVDVNGAIKSKHLYTLAYKKGGGADPPNFNVSNSYTDYPRSYITAQTYTLSSNSGFPESDSGTAITHYLNDGYTVFQYWHPYNSRNVYYRYPILTEHGSRSM